MNVFDTIIQSKYSQLSEAQGQVPTQTPVPGATATSTNPNQQQQPQQQDPTQIIANALNNLPYMDPAATTKMLNTALANVKNPQLANYWANVGFANNQFIHKPATQQVPGQTQQPQQGQAQQNTAPQSTPQSSAAAPIGNVKTANV